MRAAPEKALETHEKRREKRVPFGALLENGLLQPGEVLYLAQDPQITASVRADGRILCAEFSGSIHSTARQMLHGRPANGWEAWLVKNRQGELVRLDTLREQLRNNPVPAGITTQA